MIRAVIFDCFGVLVGGSLEYLVSLAPDGEGRAIYDLQKAADYGYISQEDFVSKASELLGIAPQEIVQIVAKRHVRHEAMVELARSLKPRFHIGLLSNAGQGVIPRLFTPEELGGGLFDAVVVSSDEGLVKPDAAIFELMARRLGVAPEECLMIDDIPRNLDGSEAVGMHGILAVSAAHVASEVERLAGTPDA